jgi:hypothetical protein
MLAFVIGLILFLTFLLLSALHFYWGLGGKWGFNAAIPTRQNHEKVLHPTAVQCFAVAFGLLGFGLFILVRVQILNFNLPPWLLKYGLWALSVLFLARAFGEFKYVGFFKSVRSTQFGQFDTKYYSPLCLVVGMLLLTLGLLG